MGLLDAYDEYVDKKCEEVAGSNSTLEKLSSALGLSNVVDGVKGYLDNGILESLKDSPLRTLGEDVLAQTINENSRRLSQNIMNVIKNVADDEVVNTLQDVRSLAFDSVVTVITFKNDMVLFFAAQIAEQAVKAIREKRAVLIELQESVRKLHNALLVLAGGGPFFNEYLANLRTALEKIYEARKSNEIVRSAFFSATIFPKSQFEREKQLLDEAYDLIMPPITGLDADELNQGFLKNVFVGPQYGDQLAMLMAIPKLAMQMLRSYDFYVLRTLKVNALLLAFQNCVQNIKEITGDKFKTHILTLLDKQSLSLTDLIESMALQLNGDVDAVFGPITQEITKRVDSAGNVTSSATKIYEPNPTKTSAKAIEWSVRVKASRALLELIDPDSLQNLTLSNEALRRYNQAIKDLETKDDRRSSLAILKATDGREQLGDIEADLITLAFQANQAIIDSALTETENGRFDSKSVISLGAKVNSRLQLSIDQDREIEEILLRFIAATGPLLDSIRDLGNSLFRMLDDLGMDRASESLRSGLFGDFFAMNSQTATYAGAAMTGLALTQNLLQDESQKQCLQKAVNKLVIEDRSKRLGASRDVQSNYAKQQTANENKCKERKKDKSRVERCSSQIDLNELKDNPQRSLSGLFNGVFGGSISDSLPFTEKYFKNMEAASISVEDANNAANTAESAAKKEMSAAISAVPGLEASEDEPFDVLKKKAEVAAEAATGDAKTALEESSITAKVSELFSKEAADTAKKATSFPDLFNKLVP